MCKVKELYLSVIMGIFILFQPLSVNGQEIHVDINKPPSLLFQEAQKSFDKAGKIQAYLYAPLEMRKAREALNQAVVLKDELRDEKVEKERNAKLKELGELSIILYFNSEIAISTARNFFIEKEMHKTMRATSQYEAEYKLLLKNHETFKKLLVQKNKLKSEITSLSKAVESLRGARAEAFALLKKANLGEMEAQKEKENILVSLENAQRDTIAALQVKAQAEKEKLEALQEKNKALEKMMLALKEKEEALRQREEAIRKVEEIEKERQKLKKKLSFMSVEFARVSQEKRGLVVSLSDILFDIDKATLAPGTMDKLAKLANILEDFPEKNILVEGHTDNTGDIKYNQRLSEKRAYSVMAFLISHGVKADRISARGFGMTKPIASNKTAEGRQQNRRVDIVILEDKEEKKQEETGMITSD